MGGRGYIPVAQRENQGGSAVKKNGKLKPGEPNEATEWYASGEGMWINQYLRGRDYFNGVELNDYEKRMLNELDIATSGKIKDDTLFRSVDASAIFGEMSDTDYENLHDYLVYGANSFGKGSYAENIKRNVERMIANADGKTMTEKGFMSTTASREVAEDFGGWTGSKKPIVMEIKTSKNTKGVDISSYDKNVYPDDAQYERLLARNQQYDIQKIYSKNGKIYINVKMR